MEDMGSYFQRGREWKNEDLGSKSSMSIKGAGEDGKKDSQLINRSINQQLNQ